MVGPIESVTIEVDDLDSSLRLLREELGLSVLSDARASVGHLGAWDCPVHASVRLVELGSAPRHPTLRLAVVEDLARTPGGVRAPRVEWDARQAPRFGLCALELRAAPELGDTPTSQGPLEVKRGPGGLPLFVARAATHGGACSLGSVWIASAQCAASVGFYAQGLGFTQPESAAMLPVGGGAERPICEALRIDPRLPHPLTRFRCADGADAGIALLRLDPADGSDPGAGSAADSQPSIRLLTARCDDLDAARERLLALGIEPLSPPTHIGLPSGRPGRVMVVRGPSAELIELVDAAT